MSVILKSFDPDIQVEKIHLECHPDYPNNLLRSYVKVVVADSDNVDDIKETYIFLNVVHLDLDHIHKLISTITIQDLEELKDKQIPMDYKLSDFALLPLEGQPLQACNPLL